MNIALFDFDGTISNTDTFTQFIYFATNKKKVRLGKVMLLPSIISYKLGMLSGSEIRHRLYKFAFKDIDERVLKEKGEVFADKILPRFVRDKAMQQIRWHQQRGDAVIVVSASLDVYLKPWCQQNGLALICNEVESVNECLTGAFKDVGKRGLQSRDCSGLEKQLRVLDRYQLSDFDMVYAYGDTIEDKELLDLADYTFYQHF